MDSASDAREREKKLPLAAERAAVISAARNYRPHMSVNNGRPQFDRAIQDLTDAALALGMSHTHDHGHTYAHDHAHTDAERDANNHSHEHHHPDTDRNADALATERAAVITAAGWQVDWVAAPETATEREFAAALDAYRDAVAIAELETAAEGGGCCMCDLPYPGWVCLAHQRLAELRAAALAI